MKTTTKIVAAVAAAAALAIAGVVSAQPGYGPGFGMGPGWGGMMGPGWGSTGGWGGMGPGGGYMGGWGGMGPGWGHMGGWSGGPGGFGMMGYGFDMSDAAAARLAAMKTQLQITPAQESAWNAYATAVTNQAKAMQTLRDQSHEQWQNAKPGEPVPDMTAHHDAMFAIAQSGWEEQNKALKGLYGVLTPQQQSFFGGGWTGPRGVPRR